MSESSRLQGTVLRITTDSTGLGKGVAFTLVGSKLDGGMVPIRAEWIEITSVDPNLLTRTENSNPRVQGTLADGRFVEVEIGDAIPSPDGITDAPPRFGVLRLRCFEYRPAGWGTRAWLFSLLNFKLGDSNRFSLHLTTECRGDGSSAWYRDTTSFVYADREWFLTDLLDGNDDKELRDFRKHWTPIRSAELWTEQQEGDDREAIELLARDIANVLSFATGRCTRWLDCTQLDAREQVVGRSGYSIWVAAAKDGGNGPIDTGEPQGFQAFMNAACTVVEADTEWWARTLELHLQGALSPIVDVQLTFYFMLLDRVSEKVTGTKWPKQIDPDIDARLKDEVWRKSFESALQSLSPK